MVLIQQNIVIEGVTHSLEVSDSAGDGGSSYQVLIDNRYVGAIVKYSTGWAPAFNHSEKVDLLSPDDIGAILDAVQQHEANS